jgi:bla regulator protein BlaR1
MIPTDLSPMANHLWQSTLCAALAWLLTLALRWNRAAVRYSIWLAASVKFLIPFSLLVSAGNHFAWRDAPAISVTMDQIVRPFALPVSELPIVATVQAASNPLPAILLVVWFCGFVLGIIYWTQRWRQVRAARRSAKLLDLNLPISVLSSPSRMEPGVFGILHPVLLLPEGIASRLTAPQLQAILAHELCHVRRRDNLTGAVQMLVETIFWFHPLIWWIRVRLIEERERACDEDVLRHTNDPQDYAEGILNVCKFFLESPLVCASGVTGADLKKRIEAIMANRVARSLNAGRTALILTAAVIAGAGPVAVGVLGTQPIHGQTQAETALPAFEVASVKPTKPGTKGFIGVRPGGQRFEATNASLKHIIIMAYNITERQISGGPNWLESDTFDIDAKASRPTTREQIYLMVQTLLADRFKLRLTREAKEEPVYALLVDKGGPKLKLHEIQDGAQPLIRAGSAFGQMLFQNVPVSRLAWFLSTQVGRSVLDKTDLEGSYDFTLNYTPEVSKGGYIPDTSAKDLPDPSILTAVREQLGLKVQSQRGMVEFFTVAHVEKPSEN